MGLGAVWDSEGAHNIIWKSQNIEKPLEWEDCELPASREFWVIWRRGLNDRASRTAANGQPFTVFSFIWKFICVLEKEEYSVTWCYIRAALFVTQHGKGISSNGIGLFNRKDNFILGKYKCSGWSLVNQKLLNGRLNLCLRLTDWLFKPLVVFKLVTLREESSFLSFDSLTGSSFASAVSVVVCSTSGILLAKVSKHELLQAVLWNALVFFAYSPQTFDTVTTRNWNIK